MLSTVLLIASVAVFITAAVLTFKNKISFFKGICISVFGFVTSFIASVASVKAQTGVSPIDTAINTVFDTVKEVFTTDTALLNLLKAAGGGDDLATGIAAVIETLRQLYIVLFPAIVIVSYAFLCFLAFMLIKSVRRLMKKDVSFIPVFNQLRVGKPAAAAFALSLACGFLFSGSVFGNAFLNVQLIISSYIMLCGASLLDFWLSLRIRYGFVRLLLYAGAVFAGGGFAAIVLEIASFAALLDVFFDFRKRYYA